MKKILILLFVLGIFLFSSCTKIDIIPNNTNNTLNETNVGEKNSSSIIGTNETQLNTSNTGQKTEINNSVQTNQSTQVLPEDKDNTKHEQDEVNKETLAITPEIFTNYERWYQCRGACRFDCNAKKTWYLNEDIDESDFCVCTCKNKETFNIENFEMIGLKVIQSNLNSVVVEYTDKRN